MSANPAEHSALIEGLYGKRIAAAQLAGDADPALLHPQELQCVPLAREVRLRQFAGGRLCARLALERLGLPAAALPMAAEGRWPLWPALATGSISHTPGFCGAAVGRTADYVGIGLDVEAIDAPAAHLGPRICTAAELGRITQLPEPQQRLALALTFSAKEAFYKAQHAVTRAAVGMQEVRIEWDAALSGEGAFRVVPTARLSLESLVPGPWPGRWRFQGSWVLTGLALMRPQ